MAPVSREFLTSLGIEFMINYLRKSRADEEHEKRTGENVLQAQKELMDRVLEPIGIPYDQRMEVGSGDKISTRPVFQGVIENLQQNKYQAIAVKEISRMGRGSYTDMGIIYDLIVDNRIYILTPYKLYDPRNPSDLRQIRFELFMSREEFETTRERLVGGRVNNAIQGRWVAGAAPFGYSYNKSTKTLEIKDDEAAVVRLIYDYYVNGVPNGPDGSRREVSFRALATYLTNKTPLLTPSGKKNWQPQVLRQLLSNDRYIGILRFRTTQRVNGKIVDRPQEEHIIIPDAFEPIIDEDTWEKAQTKFKDTAHKPRAKMDFSPCELAGLCICSVCGRRMVRQYSVQNYTAKKSGEVTQYHKEFLWCTTASCTFVKYRDVENEIIEVLKSLNELNDEELEATFQSVVEGAKKSAQFKGPETDIKDYIDQRTKELKKRMDFIFEKYETGKYTDEMFDERKAEVDKELSHLQTLADQSQSDGESSEEVNTKIVRSNISSLLEAYERSEDKTEKNKLLRAAFEYVEVHLVQKGRGRIPAVFNLRISIHPALNSNLILV